MSAATTRGAMRRLHERICERCADIRDGVTAGWCAAAIRRYGELGLQMLAEEAYEREDWAEYRRLVAVSMRVVEAAGREPGAAPGRREGDGA